MANPLAKLISMLTPKRWWAQFSLLTLFLVVTVLCVGLRLVVVPAERQQRAVAAIEALGGEVQYFELDQEDPNHEPFLRRWLPPDYIDEVRVVDLGGRPVTDAGMENLRGLTGLQVLFLDLTRVTDAGLAQLQGFTRLEYLSLTCTQVTDAGLAHLQGLTGLQVLDLDGTLFTDAGPGRAHFVTALF
jgi:hypothetical protein